MAKVDPQLLAHLEWLGFVQPVERTAAAKPPPPGLVVSPTALVKAGAVLPRSDIEGQAALREVADDEKLSTGFEPFARRVLDWQFTPNYYAGGDGTVIPDALVVRLDDLDETLQPDFAVRERDPVDGSSEWQLLVRELAPQQPFDRAEETGGRLDASPHGRMERLLRETGVSAGLLCNGEALRLISAPRGESSGWLEFRVAEMTQTAGRPILAALRLLLKQPRLLTLPRAERLSALLADSRRYQNEVSEKLAEQVLHALYELLRGMQSANHAAAGELLREPLREEPDKVYRALLTVILRLLFVLYAEEREMLLDEPTFTRYYSLAALYDRLREDAAQYPDTMDQRFGAWAQLLTLFRMVYDGAGAGERRMPPRHGDLFDPDQYPFLEGRTGRRQRGERIEPPRVPDGTVWRALDKLLVLEGERLSYRALDVEQIGSVYETMMGFRLERVTGRSLAIKAAKAHGAPTAIDLEALLQVESAKRASRLNDVADRKLTAGQAVPVRAAMTVEELQAALAPVTDRMATPELVPAGGLVLQPSEERRRSGSHYTPRTLTAPIVRTTLEPVLARLGESPHPEAILELKLCDPAIGSGAFLVEACRQLGDALIAAWEAHDARPEVPADEDEVVLARRLVAQRCLYGVDKNPVAVDLAKLSLWLVTLAREHAFTFLDHALRHGDSLVGLTTRQIEAFHWTRNADEFAALRLRDDVARAAQLRAEIRRARDDVPDAALRQLWDDAEYELRRVRLYGDLAVLAFFSGAKVTERETKRSELIDAITDGRVEEYVPELEDRRNTGTLMPFHWWVEFPEVFDREPPGFDAIVGNPPFMGGSKISGGLSDGYRDWLLELHQGSHGNGDLVAHFFRRAFGLLRTNGAFGLIATNTIGQGDTRGTGLRWILKHGGEIFAAQRRLKWPGMAAVVVSVVHVTNGNRLRAALNGRDVKRITAFLFETGGDDDPERLNANAGRSFMGSKTYGNGFTFDDDNPSGLASPVSDMRRLIADEPHNQEVIFPYIGGAEVNDNPMQGHRRYVINFGERDEDECRRHWPALMTIAENRVKPERMKNNRETRRKYWWRFGETTPALFRAVKGLRRVLVVSRVGQHAAFAFLPARMVYSEALIIFPLTSYAAFCSLQSRPHETWARFFGSSMKDDLRYTASDCFETFPFPEAWTERPDLEAAGRAYYEFRAQLMIDNDEGLTKTYNRFHDPAEIDARIVELRALHAAMDRAILNSYGWDDVPTDCVFLLDHEDDAEESRRKKPWRYRWPDAVRDNVLARLIALNGERAEAEKRSGAAAQMQPQRPQLAVQAEELL